MTNVHTFSRYVMNITVIDGNSSGSIIGILGPWLIHIRILFSIDTHTACIRPNFNVGHGIVICPVKGEVLTLKSIRYSRSTTTKDLNMMYIFLYPDRTGYIDHTSAIDNDQVTARVATKTVNFNYRISSGK